MGFTVARAKEWRQAVHRDDAGREEGQLQRREDSGNSVVKDLHL